METTNTLHWAASPVKYVGVNDDDTGHNRFHQEPVIPFALKYKPAENPPHLTENQRTDILRRVNLPQLGPDEASLALSRIEFYGDYNQLSRKIEAIVSDWRAEKIAVPKLRPEAEWRIARKHSDDLAKRELLASTSALAHLDAKLAAAKAAQAEADAIEAELNTNWLEWSAIPAKAEKLVVRLANYEADGRG